MVNKNLHNRHKVLARNSNAFVGVRIDIKSVSSNRRDTHPTEIKVRIEHKISFDANRKPSQRRFPY